MLIGFTIFSELVYLFLFIKAKSLGLLDLHNNQHLFWVLTSLSILFIVYFLAYRYINWPKIQIKSLFLIIITLHLTFLLIPFLSSNDLYSYIFSTRINGLFGQNPYFTIYDSFPHDPLFHDLWTIWATQRTLYGPLFLHIGGLINYLGQNNLLFLSLSFKSLFIAANFASILLVYKITQNKKAVFLFGANPLVIFELSGNSHTESLTLFFLLLSFYFYVRPVVGFLGLLASVLVKYYSLIFMPFYLVKLKMAGLRPLLLALTFGVVMVVAMYYPFWQGPQNFDYLLSYYNGQYTSHSLFIYLGEAIFGSYRLSFQVNTIIFFLVTIGLIYKFWTGKKTIQELIFGCMLLYWTYLLTKSSLILSWYLIMLILLGSLCINWKQYQRYGLAAILFTSIYSLLIYYFVR